jgi:hypothetical protein
MKHIKLPSSCILNSTASGAILYYGGGRCIDCVDVIYLQNYSGPYPHVIGTRYRWNRNVVNILAKRRDPRHWCKL